MVYKEHYIELYVNGKQVELESQKSLNLRFNDVLFDPTKISSTQASYSFEFEVPSTPNNDKIFDYANNLSKLNKFHSRWDAEVYADGSKIFEGSLTLNGFKNKMYKVNLVSVKNYSLDDIFGDAVMYDISGTRTDQRWYIDFDGVSSINAYNASGNSSVMFPLVSYGAFQKVSTTSSMMDVDKQYTSKFVLDKYNRWWIESFYPSLNMVETMRKCFEYKGYNVSGNLFKDDFLKDVYMSVNLADGQIPDYNLGNPKFGRIHLTCLWSSDPTGDPSANFPTYTDQELKFPYLRTSQYNYNTKGLEPSSNEIEYNFSSIRIYDMMETGHGNTCITDGQTYMWQPDEKCIVIPSDGWYKIEMSVTMRLNSSSSLTAKQWLGLSTDYDAILLNKALSLEEHNLTFTPDFKITTPLEIQLVKNYTNSDDEVELIKGKNNFMCIDGKVDNPTTSALGSGSYTNYRNYPTCFPHERLGWEARINGLPWGYNDGVGQITPTETDSLGDHWSSRLGDVDYSRYGYVYKDNELMCYDPIVNPNFIMGVTSMGNKLGGGCAAVIKNGYGWSSLDSEKHSVMYNQNGYDNIYSGNFDDGNFQYSSSTFNQNTYIDAPQCTFSQTNKSISSRIYAMVYLNKDDTLRLLGIHRAYETMDGVNVTYDTSATVDLTIQAATPESESVLRFKNYGYNSPIEFDDKLRLSNWLSKEKKVSEWIQNIADAFNLDILQNGNNVTINTKKKIGQFSNYAIDIDDRVNSAEAESKGIDYPKSMAVKYKIDTDEWGAENSVLEQPGGEAKMNEADWKKYIDSGFTKIMLNDDSYVTTTSDKNLQFSYTWYDNFTWNEVNEMGVQQPIEVVLRLPVISKFTYMIDGYDYEESMKHDGYGLSQRFWFKPQPVQFISGGLSTNTYVWTASYPSEKVDLYVPVNEKNGMNLSYKTTENSLLNNYFHIGAYLSSNFVELEVYLTPNEYTSIKNGAFVRFDSDLYYPVEVGGYDPSGYNPTTLKLMKKVV